ncbi:MAG: 4Fe-4S dicluster domain-containing protein [Lachnospiraceae bacterium]|nr:4Fe-4S dicluster domain-containing protein [Lachnospiraceae bacterium]MCD7842837.1 4Fe-4S dicluster domain-containing protein [Lachnospiraceae bacterium]
MRGIYTSVNDIRKRVFAEIAKLSYEYQDGDLSQMELIPYRVIPGEVSTYRESVFLERAIVKERMRLAMGLNLRSASEHAPVSVGAEECVKPEKYYQPPLINIIKFACHKCPDNVMKVTDACQGCLAHPCREVCPKNAISFENGRSVIDQDKCIKCGKCLSVCPYGAILKLERPCAKACGMKAIGSDEYGRAEIDQDKCVSCGMCLANCPFGAIADKAQIFQTIQAIKSDTPVYAAIAPAIAGQFGPELTPGKLRSALQALGFEDVVEVAIGADLCAIEEARDFAEEVMGSPSPKLPFMATSCCPAWSMMAKKLFPQYADCISMALTPMVLTGRLIKKEHPGCKVAFIGPCAAKKLEAGRRTIRSDIDFVLTFEELMGMFEAKEVDFSSLEEQDLPQEASADGRGFAVSGGVAGAVVNCIKELYPDMEVKTESAEGLDNCRKLLSLAKAGKYNGYLLEGMACPGGCVAGAGTRQPIAKATASVGQIKKKSTAKVALESNYRELLQDLEERDLAAPPED